MQILLFHVLVGCDTHLKPYRSGASKHANTSLTFFFSVVQVHAELTMEVPVEHGLLLENLLDLAHAPFTHTSTFAKGWPVPDVVKFNARRMLGGNWEPYPIDMAFEPPCMVLSTIGAFANHLSKLNHGIWI